MSTTAAHPNPVRNWGTADRAVRDTRQTRPASAVPTERVILARPLHARQGTARPQRRVPKDIRLKPTVIPPAKRAASVKRQVVRRTAIIRRVLRAKCWPAATSATATLGVTM